MKQRNFEAAKNAIRWDRVFLLTDFFLGHSLDPLPMPDDVEEQADHHDVAAVGVDICDDALEGAAVAEAGEEVEVEHDARDDAEEPADEQQQVQVKVLLYGDPFFLTGYLDASSLRELAEKCMVNL